MRIDPEVEKQYRRTRLQGGEILLTLVGSLGECAVVSNELAGWNVARAVGVIPIKSEINPEWVHYCLRSATVQRYIHQWATTTVQATLNLRDVGRLPIPFPPQPTIERIVHILGSLDRKIDLNGRMNQTLEAIPRAIFKSWFVDFEQTPGAWGEGSLENLASLYKEPLDPSSFPEEEFDHYSIPAFDAGQSPIRESGRQIKSTKLVLPQRAILLSKLNPRISRVWRPDLSRERRSISSTEFLVVVPKKHECDLDYIYSLFSSEPFIETFASRATGTSGSHQRVRLNDLLSIRCVLPEPGLRRLYSQRVKPLFDRIALNREESRTLAALRDTLLPKLLSGELRLKQAEKIVGEAV